MGLMRHFVLVSASKVVVLYRNAYQSTMITRKRIMVVITEPSNRLNLDSILTPRFFYSTIH